jgi:hypothetical protein
MVSVKNSVLALATAFVGFTAAAGVREHKGDAEAGQVIGFADLVHNPVHWLGRAFKVSEMLLSRGRPSAA